MSMQRSIRQFTITLVTLIFPSSALAETPYYKYDSYENAAFDASEAKKRQVETARALNVPVVEIIKLSNDVVLEMRICPAGEFPLGSPKTEKGREKDEPLKRGVFPKPFYMSTTPLTQQQYKAIMGDLPEGTSAFKAEYAARVSYAQTRDSLIPAMQKYARKGWQIKLISMDQMEYATRAGTTTTWYTGNDVSQFTKAAWFKKNSDGKEHPVGKKQPNAWGFHDTLGNVWQWVTGFSDEWDNNPGVKHVVKGGGFNSPPGNNGCRSANVMVQSIPSGVRLVMIPIH